MRSCKLLKVLSGFLLLHCVCIGALLAQDDDDDGGEQILPTTAATTAEITINRVIEIGKLLLWR
jgi:hypothetical protein